MKIALGISGGVDSAIAAMLLKQAGHEIFGVTMKIWPDKSDKQNGLPVNRRSCYNTGDEEKNKQVAEICDKIGITHRVFDLSREYENTVLSYFRREYKNGRTPNPCLICNQQIKFGLLPFLAFETLGADVFATGHYARTAFNETTKRFELMRAKDAFKDQSYFLHRLTQKQLSKVIFPLGDMYKSDVRSLACEMGIPSWNEPESQDFYDGDYAELLDCADEPGEIVNTGGKVLGYHSGIWNYTIGQRRGLGIAAERPLYVKAIEPENRRVIVAYKEEALRDSFLAASFNWVSVEQIRNAEALTVKIRSSQNMLPCRVWMLGDDTVRIVLETPQGEIAAGQSAVLYKNDLVLGGGFIEYETSL